MCCRVLCSGRHSLDAGSTSPCLSLSLFLSHARARTQIVTVNNVSRSCQTSPRGENSSLIENHWVGGRPTGLGVQRVEPPSRFCSPVPVSPQNTQAAELRKVGLMQMSGRFWLGGGRLYADEGAVSAC